MNSQQRANAAGWETAISDALIKSELPATAEAAVEVRRRNARAARMDAMRAIASDIPAPEVFARYISLEVATALRNARARNGGSWQVAVDRAAQLRPLGLVEYGGRCLTAFGLKVRRCLMVGDD